VHKSRFPAVDSPPVAHHIAGSLTNPPQKKRALATNDAKTRPIENTTKMKELLPQNGAPIPI
ncbi:MAG: hypothetical protein KDE33_27750, partial [Bacteroidetes bacterium]|nr:hypothetical protein [Bacteroidota bacterium]